MTAREHFEKWVVLDSVGFGLKRDGDTYRDWRISMLWHAYEAAWGDALGEAMDVCREQREHFHGDGNSLCARGAACCVMAIAEMTVSDEAFRAVDSQIAGLE